MASGAEETPYIEAPAEKLLGRGFDGLRTIKIPQKPTEGVEELAKEHGVFIPKLHSIIHESDVDPDMKPERKIDSFEVFPDAEAIPWISDLLRMKPTRQVLGIRYTEALDLVDLPTGEYRWVRSATSELGCLYIMDNWGKVLHCVNLMTGQRSCIGPFDAESFVACYKDGVYVGTNGKDVLYVARTDDLFERLEDDNNEEGAGANDQHAGGNSEVGANGDGIEGAGAPEAAQGSGVSSIFEYEVPMEVLSTISCPRINANYGFHACTELCHRTGVITFFDDSLSFIEFNLETRGYSVYKNDKQLTRIISTTSVSTSEYKMFATSSFLKRKMYGVTTAWAEEFIASLKWPIMLIVPSMREPDVISKAAFIDSNGYLYYNSKMIALSSPIKPIDYQGMIRIYKNIFIVLDADSGIWRALKIVVP